MSANLLPYNGEVFLYPEFFKDIFMPKILNEIEFRSDKIQMFGKWYEQKRKVAFYGDKDVEYTYSKIKMQTNPWSESLKEIYDQLFFRFRIEFNSVLVNYYRNGEDYMSYHADNEKELGENPKILSVSFGQRRDFYFKHNETGEVIKIPLGQGDVLLMQGECQHYWKHSLPKRKNISSTRMNLTFRMIY